MDLRHELETLEAFEVWLNAHDGKAQAGVARVDCQCPLAHFLIESLEEPNIRVCSNGFAIGDGIAHHTHLTQEFTRQIDDGRRHREPVSYAQARDALKQARKRVAERSNRGLRHAKGRVKG